MGMLSSISIRQVAYVELQEYYVKVVSILLRSILFSLLSQ